MFVAVSLVTLPLTPVTVGAVGGDVVVTVAMVTALVCAPLATVVWATIAWLGLVSIKLVSIDHVRLRSLSGRLESRNHEPASLRVDGDAIFEGEILGEIYFGLRQKLTE